MKHSKVRFRNTTILNLISCLFHNKYYLRCCLKILVILNNVLISIIFLVPVLVWFEMPFRVKLWSVHIIAEKSRIPGNIQINRVFTFEIFSSQVFEQPHQIYCNPFDCILNQYIYCILKIMLWKSCIDYIIKNILS